MKGTIKMDVVETKERDCYDVTTDISIKDFSTSIFGKATEKITLIKALMIGLDFDVTDYVALACAVSTNTWPDGQSFEDVAKEALQFTIIEAVKEDLR